MDQSLDAQLRATLNMIPAYTWYATPSRGLIFLNERSADYGGLPSHHPLRYGTDSSPAWDSRIPFLHPEDHEETRRVWSECLRTGRPGDGTSTAPCSIAKASTSNIASSYPMVRSSNDRRCSYRTDGLRSSRRRQRQRTLRVARRHCGRRSHRAGPHGPGTRGS
jgi:hypothetical protein